MAELTNGGVLLVAGVVLSLLGVFFWPMFCIGLPLLLVGVILIAAEGGQFTKPPAFPPTEYGAGSPFPPPYPPAVPPPVAPSPPAGVPFASAPAAMRYCPSCGAPLSAGVSFCSTCGARVA